MFKIGIFSDLHLEFRDEFGFNKLSSKIGATRCDILLNAGDTHPRGVLRDRFFWEIKNDHEHYYEVHGNHDYYGNFFQPFRWMMEAKGLKIVGCTLWTDFNKEDPITMWKYPFTLADAQHILNNQGLVGKLLHCHKEDLKFITEHKPDIVVSHHAPHLLSIHPRYKNSGYLNSYFVSDLDGFICSQPNIRLWVHGHVHDPFDYVVENCQIVCNPLGYPGETYKTDDDYQVKVIEL